MRVALLLIILFGNIVAQDQDQLDSSTLDDPDSAAYLNHLLEALFSEFDLLTADSSELEDHGYSQRARKLILAWQQEISPGPLQAKMHDSLRGKDRQLLNEDLRRAGEKPQYQLRHQLQYSPSLQGWRVLNKARIWSSQGSINLVIEQDPGEERLTDHVAIALVRHDLAWTDMLILGDYHINWGGGLILRQSQARMTMNPREYKQTNQLVMRPHYSSRESGYFRGLAVDLTQGPMHGALFISNRYRQGMEKEGLFKEDADGVHPAGKHFITRRNQTMGLGVELKLPVCRLYAAALNQPDESVPAVTEYGITSTIHHDHHIQLYTTGFTRVDVRWKFSWTYTSERLIAALQYRHYDTTQDLVNGSTLALLGNSAANESGISLRFEIKNYSGQTLRYVLVAAEPVNPHSYLEYPRVQFHKLQYHYRLDHTRVRIDLQWRQEEAGVWGDIWNAQIRRNQIKKGGFSMSHHLSPLIIYRLNLKYALEGKQRSALVQQRFSGKLKGWKWSVGYVRYHIPYHSLRLSIYEAAVAESFGFFTAYNDGERFFLYCGLALLDQFIVELKLSDTRELGNPSTLKQLAMQFQLSVVL